MKSRCIQYSLLCMLALLMLFSCSGCAKEKQSSTEIKAGKDEYILYFVSIDSTQLVPKAEKFDKTLSVNSNVQKMFELLFGAADSIEYKNVLPDSVKFQGYVLHDNGLVTIDLSEAYYDAARSSQLLCRAAIVKTVTQLDGIEMVEFTVSSQPMLEGETAIGVLTSDDFVDDDNADDSKEVQDVTIYFTNVTGDKLEALQLPVNVGNDVSAEQLVIEQLLKGTTEKGYYNTIPEGTKLLSVSTKDGVCYVDFNKNFMQLGDSVKDQIVIYSVVNSLCELSTVSKVAFTIEGAQEPLYNGNIVFDQLFERNLDLVNLE